MKKLFGALFGLVLGLIFAGVGFFITFYLGFPMVNSAKESVDWPQAPGVITSSEVRRHRGDDSTTYSSEVFYEFTVESQKHTGEVVYFGDEISTSNSSTARTTVNNYPKGKEVSVYYDPDDISITVLEPGTTWSSYFFVIFGSVFLLVGLLVILGCSITIIGGGLLVAGGIFGFLGSKGNSDYDRFSADDQYSPNNNSLEPTQNDASSQWSMEDDEDDGFDI